MTTLSPMRMPSRPRQSAGPSGRKEIGRAADPPEDAALRLDHGEACDLEGRKVGADTILQDQAVVAAVVRLPYRRVDEYLGGDTGDHQLADPAVLKDRVQIRRTKG